ncbi:hypothetical protein DYB32_008405 [Aphanomyces invadans]|nr:hypothetical protein DYB32_008405 [Aphanomyces invadans]
MTRTYLMQLAATGSTMANDRVEQDEEVDEEDMEDGEDDEFRNFVDPAMILNQYLGGDEHSEELVMDEGVADPMQAA